MTDALTPRVIRELNAERDRQERAKAGPRLAVLPWAPPPQSEGDYGSGWAPSAPFEDAEPPLEDGAHAAPASPTFKRVINPADWEGKPVPSRKWIVPDIIPDETVTLLSGDGAGGKSLLALQLGAARALGREWIGLLPEPGRTLILSAEDDSDEMQRRLDDIRKFYGARMADLADMRLVDLVGEDSVLGELMKGRILPTQMYRALDAFVADFKPGLVALDALADMFSGDENSRPQAREFIALLKRLSRTHKCAILLLAHPSLNGMATGNGTSGSIPSDLGSTCRARRRATNQNLTKTFACSKRKNRIVAPRIRQ